MRAFPRRRDVDYSPPVTCHDPSFHASWLAREHHLTGEERPGTFRETKLAFPLRNPLVRVAKMMVAERDDSEALAVGWLTLRIGVPALPSLGVLLLMRTA